MPINEKDQQPRRRLTVYEPPKPPAATPDTPGPTDEVWIERFFGVIFAPFWAIGDLVRWPFERWQSWKDDEIFRTIKREDRQREAAEKKRDAPYEKIRKQAYRRSGLK
jgi:hypothetical protein